MPQPKKLAAFTLIELLVVIVILGVLMAVALPTYLRQQSKAKDSRAQSYLNYAYRVAKGETVGNGNLFPVSTSLVSAIAQSEPELTVVRSSCATVSGTSTVAVSPLSTPQRVVLCDRSDSGSYFAAHGTANGLISHQIDYAKTVESDGAIAFWRLDGSGANVSLADASGNGNGLSLSGSIAPTTGLITNDSDSGGNFIGSTITDYPYISSFNAFNSSAVTVECWVKTTDTDGSLVSYAVPTQDNHVLFFITASNQLSAFIRQSEVQATSTNLTAVGKNIDDGQIHYLAYTWRSSDGLLTIYVDGIAVKQATVGAGLSLSNGGYLMLGQEQDAVGGNLDVAQTFTGTLDDVAIYGTALSADQIADHYLTGLAN